VSAKVFMVDEKTSKGPVRRGVHRAVELAIVDSQFFCSRKQLEVHKVISRNKDIEYRKNF